MRRSSSATAHSGAKKHSAYKHEKIEEADNNVSIKQIKLPSEMRLNAQTRSGFAAADEPL